jgi:hypothetical protein
VWSVYGAKAAAEISQDFAEIQQGIVQDMIAAITDGKAVIAVRPACREEIKTGANVLATRQVR